MKTRLSYLLAALMTVALFIPAPALAQVGLEEGSALIPQRQHVKLMLVFSSDVDTIASTANDTTGVMYAAGFTATDANIVYTVASGGTVSLSVIQQAAPTFSGPWYSMAADTISATGSSAIAMAEVSDYRLPYYRLLIDGIGSNDAATNFTYLYVVFVLDPVEDVIKRP